jgi:hypothetical protein
MHCQLPLVIKKKFQAKHVPAVCCTAVLFCDFLLCLLLLPPPPPPGPVDLGAMWLHEAGEGNALYSLAKKQLNIPMSDTLQYMGGTSFNVDGSKADLGLFLVSDRWTQQQAAAAVAEAALAVAAVAAAAAAGSSCHLHRYQQRTTPAANQSSLVSTPMFMTTAAVISHEQQQAHQHHLSMHQLHWQALAQAQERHGVICCSRAGFAVWSNTMSCSTVFHSQPLACTLHNHHHEYPPPPPPRPCPPPEVLHGH